MFGTKALGVDGLVVWDLKFRCSEAPNLLCKARLGGSWDLVSMVISTLIGVISNYKYGYLNNNPSS